MDAPVGLAHGNLILLGHQALRFCDSRLAHEPSRTVTFTRPPAAPPVSGFRATRPSGRAVAEPVLPSGGPSVRFADSDRVIPCRPGQTICEAAESAGVHLEADCHQGVCGMDPVEVVEGVEHLNEIGDTERDTLETLCSREPGRYRLACMARPRAPIIVRVAKD